LTCSQGSVSNPKLKLLAVNSDQYLVRHGLMLIQDKGQGNVRRTFHDFTAPGAAVEDTEMEMVAKLGM